MVSTGTGWRPINSAPSSRSPSALVRLGRVHCLSTAGDALVTVALADSLFFSIDPSAARDRVALSLLLTMAPFAVVAPLLGPAIDRSRRGRRAMVLASCVGRAAACLVIARVLHNLLLFPGALAVLVLGKGYSVAKSSLVPSAVDDHASLVEANSRLALGGVAAGLAAAPLGIGVSHLLGPEWVLRLAAGVFAAGAVWALAVEERVEHAPVAGRIPGPLVAWPVVASAAVMALLRAVVGFVTFLVAFAFRREGAPPWWFGLVLGVSMLASLAGAFVAPRLRRRLGEELILSACLVAVGAAGILTAAYDARAWAIAVAAAAGLAASSGKLAFDALVQREAAGDVRGRSFARFEAGFQLAWVVGALLPVAVPTPLGQGGAVVAVATLAAAAVHRVATPRLRGVG